MHADPLVVRLLLNAVRVGFFVFVAWKRFVHRKEKLENDTPE